MKRSIYIVVAASVLAALSCSKEVNELTVPVEEPATMSFDATLAVPTKVELGESNGDGGYKVLWSKGDAIAVLGDTKATSGTVAPVKFTSDLTAAAAQATFIGSVVEADAYHAVYPYESALSWNESDGTIAVSLARTQTANGISSGIAVATAEDGALAFKHLTGYVKFAITDSDIKEVRFAGNDSELLAGQYYVCPDDADDNGFAGSKITELSLVPEGQTFAQGTYYFTSLPTSLTKGFTLTFVKSDGTVATKSTEKAAEIKAGDILSLGTISGLSFAQNQTPALRWVSVEPEVSRLGGDLILEVYSTSDDWAVASSDEWFTVERLNASQVKVSAAWNNIFAPRSAKVTISSTADLTAEITVTQDINFKFSSSYPCEILEDGSVKVTATNGSRIYPIDGLRYFKAVLDIAEISFTNKGQFWFFSVTDQDFGNWMTYGKLRLRTNNKTVSNYANTEYNDDMSLDFLNTMNTYEFTVTPDSEAAGNGKFIFTVNDVTIVSHSWASPFEGNDTKFDWYIGYNSAESDDTTYYIIKSCDITPIAE